MHWTELGHFNHLGQRETDSAVTGTHQEKATFVSAHYCLRWLSSVVILSAMSPTETT
jgi:hypothetical protein